MHVPDDLRYRMQSIGFDLGLTLESAVASSARFEFAMHLDQIHVHVRRIKFVLRLLDDLDYITPDDAVRLANTAESAHRLVVAAIRTTHRNGEAA
ncbi:MAG: hypothetical protein FGM24_04615 [Candidatus Kapabacteria bacterium]|nr:hypothetical protein [Candidatus Kapabacteria bacterium]